ncbi:MULTISPECIES: DUF4247 domain-containing protein [Pontibacillus]|uniref:DUF4247 domain-containing protein n=1 Tax=Pontibacillus chungwhensis TaxID=265426 RepID=A0ABY8UXJ2_9BACI|nr:MULTISPECIES: DUF4247 domain-containing protein [Pontibacillus]MCD5323853.1 DUF4247 domain-containing protein [Pontibacillus sp. HN14]WIF97214.1 DUF4247 domain-containing protein [Pontibacillus chungwhensis]
MRGVFIVVILSVLTLTGCSQGLQEFQSSSFDEGMGDSKSGMSGSRTYTFPEEPPKDEMVEQLNNKKNTSPEELIRSVFPLLDVVEGSNANQEARIYVTQRFSIQELSETLTDAFPPKRESELKEGKKIVVYPNLFVTFKESEQDKDAVFIEVASDKFVRDNYSPNFFNGYLALWFLDEVLDVDDWGKKRKKICASSGCYGGYSNSKYRSGSTGSLRGSSGRGGGPGTGK